MGPVEFTSRRSSGEQTCRPGFFASLRLSSAGSVFSAKGGVLSAKGKIKGKGKALGSVSASMYGIYIYLEAVSHLFLKEQK